MPHTRTALSLIATGVAVLLLPQPACARQEQDAAAALRTGQYEEAITAFSRQAAGSADPQVHRGRVQALAEVGRYEEAERAAREGMAKLTADAELLNTLGEVLHSRGKVSDTEAAFRQAIAGGATDSLSAQLNLATLLLERGQRDEAMRHFDRFIDVYNRSDALSANELTAVGTAVQHLGANDPQLFKDALKAYDEAIARDPGDAEPRIRLGELFLDKYNSAEAQSTFQEVLRVNPRHPRALLGMARARYFDGSDDAAELVRAALQTNPNLVSGRVFLARVLLDLEDFDGARREIEHALTVNPSSLDALSMLAAAHYLQGNRAAYDDVRRRALARNPSYAGLYVTVAELAVRHRMYREAVELAREATALDPRSWRAFGVLGLNELRIGRIEEARKNLETSFAGDPYNVWVKNTLDLLDTFSAYETRKTSHVELMLHGDEAELLFPYAAELAEEAYATLSERYGYRPEIPLRIEMYPRHADFSVRTVGLAGLGALGASFGNLLSMDSPAARESGDFNWGSTLWHEVAHAVTLGASNHRVPRWLTEGLSVLEERRARPGWGDDVTLPFLVALKQGRLLPIDQLNNGFVRPQFPEQVAFSYYQASLVAEMIERDFGLDAIRRMLQGYAQGRSTEQLFRDVLQTSPQAFQARFDAYLQERFRGPLAAVRPPTPGQPGRGAPAADDFVAQLAAGQRLFEEGQRDAARPYLERAKALFPEYAAKDSPYWYLAQIHKERGAAREAAEELRKLTALNENHYAANLLLAETLEGLGDAAGAADALERAVYIYPYEIPLHTRLAVLHERLGNWPAAVRERRAVVALRPVDRAEALYQLARAYFQAGDRAAARRETLRALEEAPSFERAQELLLQLQGEGSGSGGR